MKKELELPVSIETNILIENQDLFVHAYTNKNVSECNIGVCFFSYIVNIPFNILIIECISKLFHDLVRNVLSLTNNTTNGFWIELFYRESWT